MFLLGNHPIIIRHFAVIIRFIPPGYPVAFYGELH